MVGCVLGDVDGDAVGIVLGDRLWYTPEPEPEDGLGYPELGGDDSG